MTDLTTTMTTPLLSRDQYGPPEHFDDEIRAYRSSKRYVPTPLENLLFELSGHRCTLCHAPWLEIHHIEELSDGGKTEYENLIVLCPNCHTRVHTDSVPSKEELRHYKTKQEIAYELPVLSRLTTDEILFIQEIAKRSPQEQLVYSKSVNRDVKASTQDEAIETMKREVGHFHLQEFGMVAVELENVITRADGESVLVALRIRITGKGIKWIRYLNETNRVPTP